MTADHLDVAKTCLQCEFYNHGSSRPCRKDITLTRDDIFKSRGKIVYKVCEHFKFLKELWGI